MADEESGEATSGASTGTPLPNDLVHLANEVKAAQEIIEAIGEVAFRSITGEIGNLTDTKLTRVRIDLESGGLGNDQPHPFIEQHQSETFAARSTSLFEGGTVGSVTYRADDGTEFICGWSNPVLGSGKINFRTRGPRRNRYGVFATSSVGNTKSFRHWLIFPIPGPFSVMQFLRTRGVNRLLAIEGAKGSSLRGLMGV